MEQALVNQIISYLSYKGHYVWRNNSGVVKSDYTDKAGRYKQRMWRAGVKGGSDILGIAKSGKFIAVECKIKGNKPTELQLLFLEEIKSRGGHAIVAYELEDVQKEL